MVPLLSIAALKIVLTPIVRTLLRGSYSYQQFTDAAKEVFVAVAREEIAKTSRKINASRISVLTGLHRQDIARFIDSPEGREKTPLNPIAEILSRWEQDDRFLTKDKKPRVLEYPGPVDGFSALVLETSKNLTPGTVLFELKRRGLVAMTPRGVKKANDTDFYSAEGVEEKCKFLAEDIAGLITAVEGNLAESNSSNERGVSNLHLTTVYDNILIDEIPRIRRWLISEGKAFHKRARAFFSKYDQDISQGVQSKNAGGTVYVGTFGFTESPTQEAAELAKGRTTNTEGPPRKR